MYQEHNASEPLQHEADAPENMRNVMEAAVVLANAKNTQLLDKMEAEFANSSTTTLQHPSARELKMMVAQSEGLPQVCPAERS